MQVETLLGPRNAADLGRVYTHEHVLTNPPPSRMKIDPDYLLDSEEKIIDELKLFASVGGNTLVDCTALDYGRDAKRMVEVAKKVPVNIIGITGFNRGDYEPWVKEKSVTELAEMMIRDVQEGMDGTQAKAALLKLGTNYNNILPVEVSIIQAVAIAYKKTGKPVITHTTLGTMGVEQVELLERNGVDPRDVMLSHIDQNLDFGYLEEIARKGSYLCFDGPSKVKYAPDSARIEIIKRLCDAGFEDHIIVSGDMGRKSYLKAYGGGPGFDFLLRKFAPRMVREGIPQRVVDKFFVDNPHRYLSRGEV